MKQFIKKYLIEILILVGVWFILNPVSYNNCRGYLDIVMPLCEQGFSVDWEEMGIFIIVIAGVIILNRFLNKNKFK